eukprot:c19350_g1_i1.p1 GENE.c19350_g1_i1~~c19350_g1_i1.p1  ORF type:complete len:692 (-),score=308.11 c19350_g1_i1:58-2133(-)
MDLYHSKISQFKTHLQTVNSEKLVFNLFKAYVAWHLLRYTVRTVRGVTKYLTGSNKPKGHPGTKAVRESSHRHAVSPNEFEERFIATKERLNGKDFDFVIVGAGSAGCVLARKLSENPKVRVLLIEAGGEPQNAADVSTPHKMLNLWRSEVDWQFQTVPQPQLLPAGRIVDLERGKGLGGSSLLNYGMWVRGTKEDFDRWATEYKCGAEWSYEGVLENFKNLESVCPSSLDPRASGQVTKERGTEGPLEVRATYPPLPEVDNFIGALNHVGIPSNPDYNGPVQFGCGYTQTSSFKGRRCDAFNTFIEPILGLRPNLTIASEALVRKVVIDGEASKGNLKATGIELELRTGEILVVKATREVVLSAGGIASPQILMLSGVGDSAELKKFGIETKCHIPAVGKHLQDHPVLFVPVLVPETIASQMSKVRAANYGLPGTAFIKSPVAENREKLAKSKHSPDLEVISLSQFHTSLAVKAFLGMMDGILPSYKRNPNGLLYRTILHIGETLGKSETILRQLERTYAIALVNHAPQSRGSVRLASKNPYHAPLIDTAFLKDSSDFETLLWGVKFVRELFKTPQLAPYVGDMRDMYGIHSVFKQGKEAFFNATDDQLRTFILGTVSTTWHYSCTTKMGSDDASLDDCVCTNQLKVREIKGLRVADCSVMPFVVSANTNATAMMIGDKCGELIYREYGF